MSIKYKILKHILSKHFRNVTTHINIIGIINSTIILQNTKNKNNEYMAYYFKI